MAIFKKTILMIALVGSSDLIVAQSEIGSLGRREYIALTCASALTTLGSCLLTADAELQRVAVTVSGFATIMCAKLAAHVNNKPSMAQKAPFGFLQAKAGDAMRDVALFEYKKTSL
jgi:hypothetical protein